MGQKASRDVVKALKNEVISLTGKRPALAIKEKAVASKPSTKYSRPVGVNEKKLPPLINVRYLYQPGELEGVTKRATDPIWSLKVYQIERNVTKPDEPVVYYLSSGPKRSIFFSASFTEYIFDLTANTSSIGSPPHSSFIFPRTFLFVAS